MPHPLRRVRAAIQDMRSAGANRIDEPLPLEVQPLVEEVNALLAHSERQAEEARTHAGNLAHALKTPLTVLTNAATAHNSAASLLMRELRECERPRDTNCSSRSLRDSVCAFMSLFRTRKADKHSCPPIPGPLLCKLRRVCFEVVRKH